MIKAALWESWLKDTLLQDLRSDETPDPVPFFEHAEGEPETSSALSSYKWGKNDGEYLYLVYLLDDTDACDVTPIYVGESADISSRIGQHSRKIRNALPITEWEDDGQWGSFSKYDHIAAMRHPTLVDVGINALAIAASLGWYLLEPYIEVVRPLSPRNRQRQPGTQRPY
ncbi:GIY-YIG nuclease family protein [Natronorubrum halophilum]|uniref:GIY-YIG nuclease family protein n=1 Tax=Natronorubrum halophilum TaxID=1702106 RepID=UPI001EE8472D|nr:GIY-YIG nuclease family protein [Natronorubrum halophilum]